VCWIALGALGADHQPDDHHTNRFGWMMVHKNFLNSMLITGGVVTIISHSLWARAGWIGIRLQLSFLVADYRAGCSALCRIRFWLRLPVLHQLGRFLSPILGENAPTLYGQPLAASSPVLVSINQPFTILDAASFSRTSNVSWTRPPVWMNALTSSLPLGDHAVCAAEHHYELFSFAFI
jgi:hypothetical protein